MKKKVCYCELISNSCTTQSKKKLFVSTDVSDWLIFDLVTERGVEVRGVADLPCWDYSSLPGRSGGGGEEENNNTILSSLCQNLSHSCQSHF